MSFHPPTTTLPTFFPTKQSGIVSQGTVINFHPKDWPAQSGSSNSCPVVTVSPSGVGWWKIDCRDIISHKHICRWRVCVYVNKRNCINVSILLKYIIMEYWVGNRDSMVRIWLIASLITFCMKFEDSMMRSKSLCLYHLSLMRSCPSVLFERFFGFDGFLYLKSCAKNQLFIKLACKSWIIHFRS